MARPVLVGVDGAPESLAAADWAGREATERGLPLRILHAWEFRPSNAQSSPGTESQLEWAESRLSTTRDQLKERYPSLDVTVEKVFEAPARAILDAAEEAALVVLGSRGLSGIAGFLVGSVGASVIAHAWRPTVLVRGGERYERAVRPTVVLGLDLDHTCDPLIKFGFEAAGRRGARLRAVHVWDQRRFYGYPITVLDPLVGQEMEKRQRGLLEDMLRPWRDKYPAMELEEQLLGGSAPQHLVRAAAEADLLVIGRRIRPPAVGARLGTVCHGVLHHASCPVAVVPHD